MVSCTTVSPLPPLRRQVAVCFLWHCPAGYPGWVLPTTLPCGARTFLDATSRGDATRSPGQPIRGLRLSQPRAGVVSHGQQEHPEVHGYQFGSARSHAAPRTRRVLHRRRRPRRFEPNETGYARRVRERPRGRRTEFRFSRIGPSNRGLPEPIRRKVAKAMTAGVAITDGKHPRGLHLSRAIHRSRSDLRQDSRHVG